MRADAHLKLSARATVKLPLPQYSSSMSPVLPADTRRAQPSIFWQTPAICHVRVVDRLKCSLTEVHSVVGREQLARHADLTFKAHQGQWQPGGPCHLLAGPTVHPAAAQGPQRRQCRPASLHAGSSHGRSWLETRSGHHKRPVRGMLQGQSHLHWYATVAPPIIACTAKQLPSPVLCGLPYGCGGDKLQQN